MQAARTAVARDAARSVLHVSMKWAADACTVASK
jgi:hypothetical protein